MVFEIIFGFMILAVVALVIFRMIGNVAIGAVLVLAIFVASYLLVGSFPSLGKVPIIGNFIPKTGKVIVVKNSEYSMDVLNVARSGNSNLLVTVANTGKSEVSNFTASVNGNQVEIMNNKDSLPSGDVYVFELDWSNSYKKIIIRSSQVEAVYE